MTGYLLCFFSDLASISIILVKAKAKFYVKNLINLLVTYLIYFNLRNLTSDHTKTDFFRLIGIERKYLFLFYSIHMHISSFEKKTISSNKFADVFEYIHVRFFSKL